MQDMYLRIALEMARSEGNTNPSKRTIRRHVRLAGVVIDQMRHPSKHMYRKAFDGVDSKWSGQKAQYADALVLFYEKSLDAALEELEVWLRETPT